MSPPPPPPLFFSSLLPKAIFELKQKEHNIAAELRGIQAGARSLESNVAKLDRDNLQQQEILYKQDFQVVTLERRLLLLEVCIDIYIHTYIRTHTHTHTYIYIYIYIYILYIFIYIICIYISK